MLYKGIYRKKSETSAGDSLQKKILENLKINSCRLLFCNPLNNATLHGKHFQISSAMRRLAFQKSYYLLEPRNPKKKLKARLIYYIVVRI